MNRRSFSTFIATAIGIVAARPVFSFSTRTQSEMILFKNTQDPLIGTEVGNEWRWPGTALTANTSRFSADFLVGASLVAARWVVVWNPQVTDHIAFSPTGIRLVNFDNGPANISELARIISPSGMTYTTPKVEVIDVAPAFNAMLSAGITKQIGHQTFGNGENGCKIYGSWIEFVWN